MIAKKIQRKPGSKDRIKTLGEYIEAAREAGEKLHDFWMVNCNAGEGLEDLDTALIEVAAVQGKKRGVNDRTYHLVISFRPGEEQKLSKEDLRDIEAHFAKALGFDEHQRIVGTHINTDNFHMHVAINKVHPETLRCHTPRRDFATLARVSREMEKKYGLQVDVEEKKEQDQSQAVDPACLPASARDLLDHRVEILTDLEQSKSRDDVHKRLASYDAVLKLRGAGLVFAQINGDPLESLAPTVDFELFRPVLNKGLGQEACHRTGGVSRHFLRTAPPTEVCLHGLRDRRRRHP